MKADITLNLGGGRNSKEIELGEDAVDIIHIDIDQNAGIDILADVFNVSLPFKNNSINRIRSSHCLEHVSYKNTVNILKEWKRVLKPGSRIDIYQSNFNFKAVTWVIRSILKKEAEPGFIMGSHIGYDEHKTFFTPTLLRKNLEDAGFKNIKVTRGRNIAEYKRGVGKYIQKVVWLELHAIAYK